MDVDERSLERAAAEGDRAAADALAAAFERRGGSEFDLVSLSRVVKEFMHLLFEGSLSRDTPAGSPDTFASFKNVVDDLERVARASRRLSWSIPDDALVEDDRVPTYRVRTEFAGGYSVKYRTLSVTTFGWRAGDGQCLWRTHVTDSGKTVFVTGAFGGHEARARAYHLATCVERLGPASVAAGPGGGRA